MRACQRCGWKIDYNWDIGTEKAAQFADRGNPRNNCDVAAADAALSKGA